MERMDPNSATAAEYLPLLSASAAMITLTPAAAPVQTTTDAAFRILLIEPALDAEIAFIRTFGASASVEPVDTMAEALKLLTNGYAFDLVVASVEASGLALLDQLKAHPEWQALPVILTAPADTEPLRRRALHGKALDVFSYDSAHEAIGLRIDYLIRKRAYRSGNRADELDAVRMPFGKRAFDVLATGTVLLLISPLLAVVALLIKLDSPGPILYRSKRVGAGYRIFDMYKFRTMRQDADQQLSKMASLNIYNKATDETPATHLCAVCAAAGTTCQRPLYLDNEEICEDVYAQRKKGKATFSKFHQDPRVTRLGKILRDYSIDELPQLFNIFKGDMSLVGNRPLPLYEAEKLTTIAYARRFAAPAGLTGLWQVTKRGRATKLSDEERIQLDVLYAQKFSFWTDFVILLKTVRAVWQKESM
jgi:lipopolysaccharide/colanic/teichoic acid biosynthesis glycosyltransferase